LDPTAKGGMQKVLIVEDDQTLSETLRYNFEREGYQVSTAADGRQALELAERHRPDAVVLDVMLPELGGFDVCRALRRDSTVPILMLTAKDDEIDKVVGLELGADDYLTKPFSVRELLARVRAMLRRVEMQESPRFGTDSRLLQAENLHVNLDEHRVELAGQQLQLKPKEFDLLVFLMQRPGRVFNREQLLSQVWGYDFAGDSRTVDVHVRWLREKIEADPSQPTLIETVRGVGYRFKA
jgi:DNA-binding response OmpR family regulator